MAFQPIVDRTGRVFAQEALVRGVGGEGAGFVLSQVTDRNRYAFDQLCRMTAIRRAAELGLAGSGALLSINFSPNAIYEPARCISSSLAAARRHGLPNEALMFEVTEQEQLDDPAHLRRILTAYRALGFKVALDDFGAGYANFDILADITPDIVKLDMKLVRGLDGDRARRLIVSGIARMLDSLGVTMIAEGIETPDEYRALSDLGVRLFQGFLFARPTLDAFAAVSMPAPDDTRESLVAPPTATERANAPALVDA
ncbi:EAL domain-containing protein [Acetobacteraceae bacterium KSS8]|uniref:EAL domain-containing protein n=2 Tax=Endosaccharibacter trunci TaxID=2812733 RepID=A0ABT1W4Q7_9PROT|nr:EAL domain-containing protein [Acetobacteraceae bacterium KSS8]